MNKVWIDERYCKGCLICVEVCPTKAIQSSAECNARGYRLPREENMTLCKGCGLCVLMCPDFAIAIESGCHSARKEKNDMCHGSTGGG